MEVAGADGVGEFRQSPQGIPSVRGFHLFIFLSHFDRAGRVLRRVASF